MSEPKSAPPRWDVHPRLLMLAREAIAAGVDDDAWLEAAARAYQHALTSGPDLL
ncbi:MAG: hypothetical protein ACR2OU_02405 [Thermomicrobiales bacterium]